MTTVGEPDRAAPGAGRPRTDDGSDAGGGGAARWYRRDPLGFVERAARERGPVFRLPDDGSLCVADPETALRVLHDDEGHYDEVSGFFHVPGGVLGPRSTQVAIGRAARATVRAHLAAHRDRLPAIVAELGEVSAWPAAGRAATYRFLTGMLLRPDSPPGLRELMAKVVRHDVLIRSGGPLTRARRRVLWAHVVRTLAAEVLTRRAGPHAARPDRPPTWQTGVRPALPDHPPTPHTGPRPARSGDRPAGRSDEPPSRRDGPAGDLLDAVIGAVPDDTPAAQVAQVYLLLFRTSVAPVGHVVAWALLAAATHGVDLAAVPAESAVRESLRLWPVAWLLGRPVRRAHQVGGVRLEPGESVSVCSYLLHRDERHWPQAARFRPGRWDGAGPRGPYLPFGGGPYTCAGAAVAHALATGLLSAVTDGARLEVRGGHGRPHVAGIITPPPFELRRTRHQA
ncbi:cytochrome P450 [Nonomuraea sp. NPDC050643]|uniref:cytochrome P450 n=1 Tax=Nonomuraea sp. NPDC050643 TaxID=3155660 RepID=UPI0033F0C15A